MEKFATSFWCRIFGDALLMSPNFYISTKYSSFTNMR